MSSVISIIIVAVIATGLPLLPPKPHHPILEGRGSEFETIYRVAIVSSSPIPQPLSKHLPCVYSHFSFHIHFLKPSLGFPGGAVVKNPPANAGDTGSSPGPGRSHMLQSN